MRVKIAREFDVVLPCDEGLPREEQTVFHCRRLTYEQETRIATIAGKVSVAEANRLAIKLSLVGVTNLRDGEGNQVPYKTAHESVLGKSQTVVHDEFLDLIDSDSRLDLANKILDANRLTEDDAKN